MNKAILVSSTVLVVLVLVACLLPIRNEAYALTVNHTEPVTEYVNLAYSIDDYMRTEIVQEYRQTGSCGCKRELVDVEYDVFGVNITNTDNVPGQFLVMLSGIESGKPYSKNVTVSLNVSEHTIIEYQAEVIDCCDFEIYPTGKEIETGEFETVQHEEIRYKKVTALDYLLHYK